MADHSVPNFQIPPEMRAFAEQSVAQARTAFDGVMTAAQGAVATFEGRAVAAQAGAKDMQRKAIAFAEHNVTASFEFAQQLLAAKNADEVMKLHADYVKAQMQTLGAQARDLGETAAKAASAPPQD